MALTIKVNGAEASHDFAGSPLLWFYGRLGMTGTSRAAWRCAAVHGPSERAATVLRDSVEHRR